MQKELITERQFLKEILNSILHKGTVLGINHKEKPLVNKMLLYIFTKNVAEGHLCYACNKEIGTTKDCSACVAYVKSFKEKIEKYCWLF